MKKLFTILILLSACSVALFSAEGEKTYKLVSSIDEITEGAYLIAAKSGDTWYAMGYQSKRDYRRPAVQVTVSENNMITTQIATSSSETDLPYEIEINKVSTGYYLIDNLGGTTYCYLGKGTASDNDKHLTLQAGRNKDSQWQMGTMGEDGSVSVSMDKSYMGMYVSNSVYFRCFFNDSSQKVYFFKETDEVDEPVEPEPVVVTPPEFSLPGGTYQGAQTVTLSAGEGMSIYYSLDAEASFEPYSAPITISSSATLCAYAQDADGNRSETVSAAYVIEEPTEPDPDPEEPEDPMSGIIEDASTPAVWVRRFYESFDKNNADGGNDGNWKGMAWGTDLASGGVETPKSLPAENVDNEGWEITQGAVRAASRCIVFKGLYYIDDYNISHYYAGELTSPELGFSGSALLRFKVGTWEATGEKVGLTLSLSSSGSARFVLDDGSESTKYEVPGVSQGQFITVEVLLAHVENATSITFCTPVERSSENSGTTRTFLDEVEVYELRSAGEQVDWSEGEDALVSGSWTSTQLTSTLGQTDWNPATGTELDLTGAQLAANFTVDNTDGNPNLLVYTDTEVTVTNGINVVNGALPGSGTVLTDLRDFSLKENVSGDVSYVRSFIGVDAETAGGWSVLCLPFNVTQVTDTSGNKYIPYSEWMGAQSTTVGFYWLKQATTGENAINTDADAIKANVPYLIAFPKYDYEEYPLLQVAESTVFTFSGSGLSATVELEAADMEQWEYHVNYRTTDAASGYVLNEDGSAFELGAEQLSPFRPYVTYKEAATVLNAPKLFPIGADNTPSRLLELVFPNKSVSSLRVEVAGGELRLTALENTRVMIHTSGGLLLQEFMLRSGESRTVSLQSGVYIVNNQKVVVSENR